jgi:hypothetical protein
VNELRTLHEHNVLVRVIVENVGYTLRMLFITRIQIQRSKPTITVFVFISNDWMHVRAIGRVRKRARLVWSVRLRGETRSKAHSYARWDCATHTNLRRKRKRERRVQSRDLHCSTAIGLVRPPTKAQEDFIIRNALRCSVDHLLEGSKTSKPFEAESLRGGRCGWSWPYRRGPTQQCN